MMRVDDDRTLRRHILKKLYAYGAFANGHLLGERLWQGIPGHLRGAAKHTLKELVRESIITEYPTEHGMAYQLDIRQLERIEQEIFP